MQQPSSRRRKLRCPGEPCQAKTRRWPTGAGWSGASATYKPEQMMAAQTVLVLLLSVRYKDACNKPSLLHAFLRADPLVILPQPSRDIAYNKA